MSGSSAGLPGYFYMQRQLWVVIGAVIAFASLVNLLNFLLLRQRLRSRNAKPTSWFWSSYATATAIAREFSNASLPSYRAGPIIIRSPALGKTSVVISWLITILVFCFYGYDTFDQWSWENIAYRAGCVALSQLPLVFLLAGKQNIIGYLTGTSYERLNWLHRWVARILWMTVTIHMGFWFRSWARYAYILTKLRTDSMTQTGFASWCILTAILLTSFYPMRKLNYEVFVILHLILFAGLVGAIYIHVDFGKAYVWSCVGIFFLDRFFRLLIVAWANFSFLHKGRREFWANQATLTPLPGNVTKISIENPVITWKPGQHMFVSCHSVVPLQSHPFTALTLPSDGKLEFLVQAQRGGTKRFLRWASKYQPLPGSEIPASRERKFIGIEGPYGTIRPLQQFDSILLFAGSTGATFTIPLLRDIVERWQTESTDSVAKKVRFIWVIKAKDRLCWFEDEIKKALVDTMDLRAANRNVSLEIGVYITCDEELEATASPADCSPPSHGEVQLSPHQEERAPDEKRSQTDQIKETSSTISDSDGCGPDEGCCCKHGTDEMNPEKGCCCRQEVSNSTSTQPVAKENDPLSIRLYTGRPKIRPLIRKMLEEAEGESAVVVCGPRGLQNDVRRNVVSLSDERAVHKGTGAQGVYLHVEGFSY